MILALVSDAWLADFNQPPGAHRDGLAMFAVVDASHRGKVDFTVGRELAIYEGEPEDVGWFMIGLLTAGDHDRALAEAMLTFIASQLPGRTPGPVPRGRVARPVSFNSSISLERTGRP